MPRRGKGSKVANPNRTDLNTAAPTGDDREYGANKRDQEAMDQVPVQPQPIPGPMPGELGGLAAPTNRPNVPITNGIGLGPGAGPEARMIKPVGMYKTPLERVAEATQNPRLLAMVRRQRGY